MTTPINQAEMPPLAAFSLTRMVNAVEKVRLRLLRATQALAAANVAYAVVGGNAIAAWVARVDESAVRNTQDVNILLRRQDLLQATTALATQGFVYCHLAGIDVFLDGKVRDGVHIIYALEKVHEHELLANPDVSDFEEADQFRILKLEALVQVKLTAFRDKDRVHLRDLIDVGLIDAI
jgi:hypothetical protein